MARRARPTLRCLREDLGQAAPVPCQNSRIGADLVFRVR